MPARARGLTLTPDAARALDERAERAGYPVLLLMENAGRGATVIATDMLAMAAEERAARAPAKNAQLARSRRGVEALVLAGPGNNGGDALVVARHLHASGHRVVCVLAAGAKSPACREMLRRAERAGVRVVDARKGLSGVTRALRARAPALVVDGLFGTGLSRALGGVSRELVLLAEELREGAGARVLSLDVPSGMDAARGKVVGGAQGIAVRADVTATFAAPKTGLLTKQGRALCGEVRVVSLGLPAGLVSSAGAGRRCG